MHEALPRRPSRPVTNATTFACSFLQCRKWFWLFRCLHPGSSYMAAAMRSTNCNAIRHTATQYTTPQHTATHAATLYNTPRHTATHCTTLHHTLPHCNTLRHTAIHCNTLQYTATNIEGLQVHLTHVHIATQCNTMQHNATQCNTMQHNATQCNTMQHTHCKMMKGSDLMHVFQRLAVCCSVYGGQSTYLLQCFAVCYSMLQYVAICCR